MIPMFWNSVDPQKIKMEISIVTYILAAIGWLMMFWILMTGIGLIIDRVTGKDYTNRIG